MGRFVAQAVHHRTRTTDRHHDDQGRRHPSCHEPFQAAHDGREREGEDQAENQRDEESIRQSQGGHSQDGVRSPLSE